MEVILTGQSTKISTEIFQKNNFKAKYLRQLIRYRMKDGIAQTVGTQMILPNGFAKAVEKSDNY